MLCKKWTGDGCSFQGNVPNAVPLHPKLNGGRCRQGLPRIVRSHWWSLIAGLWNVSISKWLHELCVQDGYYVPILEISVDFAMAISTPVERKQTDWHVWTLASACQQLVLFSLPFCTTLCVLGAGGKVRMLWSKKNRKPRNVESNEWFPRNVNIFSFTPRVFPRL